MYRVLDTPVLNVVTDNKKGRYSYNFGLIFLLKALYINRLNIKTNKWVKTVLER